MRSVIRRVFLVVFTFPFIFLQSRFKKTVEMSTETHPVIMEALAISCLDGRFREWVEKWISDEFGDQADHVKLAGASNVFTHREWKNVGLDQVRLAVNLHGVKKLCLIDHMDCGAFGGSRKHNHNRESEIRFHFQQLEAARRIVLEHFPELEVKIYLMDFEGAMLDENDMVQRSAIPVRQGVTVR